ncbi:MAG: arginine repressor [Bacillota bacterium]
MKSRRQMRILSLLKERDIATQNDLVDALNDEGIRVTQATVSRDIKELSLVKASTESGGYRYMEPSSVKRHEVSDQLLLTLANSVTRIQSSECMLVIDTLPATAQIVAEAIDALGWEQVLGTLAGERTVFAVIKSKELVPEVIHRLSELCSRRRKSD